MRLKVPEVVSCETLYPGDQIIWEGRKVEVDAIVPDGLYWWTVVYSDDKATHEAIVPDSQVFDLIEPAKYLEGFDIEDEV